MRYMLYSFTIVILLLAACLKNSSQPEEKDPLRYNYPDYRDGRIRFHHSFYHDCGDDEYWTGLFRSRDFSVNDSLFLLISEEIGFKQEVPNLNLKEEATLICSNGDQEKIIFNLPYPQCIDHIQNFFLRFGGIPSNKRSVNKYNGYIDVQQDTVLVIVHYKSYWTDNIVNDTAYVSP